MDGGDGYWYGFANQGNSSGSATVLWIKIRKSDYTFTEGQWTLSNATLMTMGSFKEGSRYPSRNRSAVVRNGYLYVPSYEKTGVYKINISNSTDVTLISLGFTSTMKCLGETGSCDCCMSIINDIIVAYDFEIDVNDNVIATFAGIFPALREQGVKSPLFIGAVPFLNGGGTDGYGFPLRVRIGFFCGPAEELIIAYGRVTGAGLQRGDDTVTEKGCFLFLIKSHGVTSRSLTVRPARGRAICPHR